MKKTYNLGWGCPHIVRQALIDILGRNFPMNTPFYEMSYPEHHGDPVLVEQLKDLALRQSGKRPKHLFVTNGATAAINASLYTLKTDYTDWVVTGKRYFPLYPKIINLTEMSRVDKSWKEDHMRPEMGLLEHNFINLVDSPSAPEGLVSPFEGADIWDAAYVSRTYGGNSGNAPLSWKIMCGSASKTLGLSGLRIGWAATDSDVIAEKLSDWVSANYAGLSVLSMKTASHVLHTLDLDKFEAKSYDYINDNRDEVQKILTKFGQGSVPCRGMFAILQLGKTEKKAFEKANIIWQPGPSWGETEDWARLSLGQTRELTREAVKAVLK